MTVPTPPSANVPVPSGNAMGWGRPAPSSPRTAEEDFGRQLAGIAVGDRGGKQAAALREGVVDVSMARLQTGDFDWARARGVDDIAIAAATADVAAADVAAAADITTARDATATSDITAAGEAVRVVAAPGAAMLPAPIAALPLAVPLHGQQVQEQAAPPVSRAPQPVEAKLKRILMDAPEPARTDAMLPAARAPATPSMPVVNVASRETHLPPAAMPVREGAKLPVAQAAALRESAPLAEGKASREVVDLLAGDVRPVPAVAQQSQGGDTRRWSGQGSQPGPLWVQSGARQESAAEDAQPPVDAASQSSVTREAHGLPQAPSSPLRQIADKIVSELQSPADTSRPSAVPAPASPAPHTVLKVLTIQLHPAELGAVTVRIALRDDALELQIEAGRHDTARLVEADRDGLSSQLRLAGYSVETLIVRAVEMPSAAAQTGPSPMPSDGGATQAQSGGAQGNAGASGGRHQPNQHANHHLTPRHGNDEPDSTRRRLGDGLYL